jgi:hypothetical protein
VSFSSAIVLAYLTGMVTAFVLAKWLVFKHTGIGGHDGPEYPQFHGVPVATALLAAVVVRLGTM